MGKLASMVSQNVIDGFKGKIDFYVYKGMPCFRRWPNKRRGQFSPAEMSGWAPFANSSRLWNELSPEIRAIYDSMASDSGLSGRDLFTRSYMSGLYRNPLP